MWEQKIAWQEISKYKYTDFSELFQYTQTVLQIRVKILTQLKLSFLSP